MSTAASPRAEVKAGNRHLAAGNNPEFELLVACTSPSQAPIITGPVNWDRVLQLAQHHGVVPQLSQALEKSGAGVPPTALDSIFSENRNNTRQALWLTRELFRILEQLSARNVDALPYKGPLLAEQLYGNVAARQFNDIDILIRQRDLPIAVAGLHELGYEPGIELTPRQELAYLRSGYEYTFDGEHGRNLVELQWKVLPRFYAVDLKTEDLFHRSQAASINGQVVRSLCREDLLIVLCLHAAKHGWAQLSWLSDITRLAEDASLDWEAVRRCSAELRIERIVSLTLALCGRLWGTRFQVSVAPECELLSEQQLQLLRAGEEFDPESLAYFRRMLEVRESGRDRLRFLWRLATTSGVGEWSAIRLPAQLFPLYGAVRAYRLATRFLRSR